MMMPENSSYVCLDDMIVKYNGNDENVIIPEGVVAIGNNAFAHNHDIKSVVFPDSLRYIGEMAFYGCKNLTDVRLNDGLAVIGGGAFGNTRISDITFPDSLTRIGYEAFDNTRIEADQLPSSTKAVQLDSFSRSVNFTDAQNLYDINKGFGDRGLAEQNSFVAVNVTAGYEVGRYHWSDADLPSGPFSRAWTFIGDKYILYKKTEEDYDSDNGIFVNDWADYHFVPFITVQECMAPNEIYLIGKKPFLAIDSHTLVCMTYTNTVDSDLLDRDYPDIYDNYETYLEFVHDYIGGFMRDNARFYN